MWSSDVVGLGIVTILAAEENNSDAESSTRKYIIFRTLEFDAVNFMGTGAEATALFNKSISLPRNHLISETVDLSPKPAQFSPHFVSLEETKKLLSSLTAEEVEQSEDYTCITTHGPNPKKIQIFCDHILEDPILDMINTKSEEDKRVKFTFPLSFTHSRFPEGFLSFCFYCKKKLDQTEDIYIYRGEKAFCSPVCRDSKVLPDERWAKWEKSCREAAQKKAAESTSCNRAILVETM